MFLIRIFRQREFGQRGGVEVRLLGVDRIGITPACGLSGATEEWARIAIGLVQKAADGVETDPEGI